MHKLPTEVLLCCGIDVSAAQLVVALEGGDGGDGCSVVFPTAPADTRR